MNELGELMLWSLISLTLQYYKHWLLSYNHNQVIHSLQWEANSGSNSSSAIFQPLPKETTKYHCFALPLSILHEHFRMIIL